MAMVLVICQTRLVRVCLTWGLGFKRNLSVLPRVPQIYILAFNFINRVTVLSAGVGPTDFVLRLPTATIHLASWPISIAEANGGCQVLTLFFFKRRHLRHHAFPDTIARLDL